MKKLTSIFFFIFVALSAFSQARDIFRPAPAPHLGQPLMVERIALINGRTIAYDACTSTADAPGNGWVCMGKGTIYSINGVRQTGDAQFWFWFCCPNCRTINCSSDTNREHDQPTINPRPRTYRAYCRHNNVQPCGIGFSLCRCYIARRCAHGLPYVFRSWRNSRDKRSLSLGYP